MPETPSNVIYIGKKGPMAYVLGAITQFSNGNNEVHIRARGNAITRAVDVAEIIRRRFLKEVNVKNIEISTDQVESKDSKEKLNISTISITLSK